MDTQGLVLIIGVLTSSVLAVIAAIFSGVIALKQLPKIHEAVNTNYQKMQSDLDIVRAELKSVREEKANVQDQRLADAQAREVPVPVAAPAPVAAEPTPAAPITMADVELAIHKAAAAGSPPAETHLGGAA